MLTAQDTFEPPEEELDLPSVLKEDSNSFSRQGKEVCCQQEGVVDLSGAEGFFTGDPGRTAPGFIPFMEHLDDPQRVRTVIFSAVTAQGDDEIFLYPCNVIIFRQGVFFKDRVGSIIS